MAACTEERFLGDVIDHKMEIIRDDGVYRHLRFEIPGTIRHRFDLITWPGHLCITSDCGVYVFIKMLDMFKFFRGDGLGGGNNKTLYINKERSSKSVSSKDCIGGIKEFSSIAFIVAVKSAFDTYFERCKQADISTEFTTKINEASKAECWREIEEKVLNCTCEREAYMALNSFRHSGFTFQGFRKYPITDYTFNYLWCLYAIVWGIAQYDKKVK